MLKKRIIALQKTPPILTYSHCLSFVINHISFLLLHQKNQITEWAFWKWVTHY
jgi:hypothetical protein